MEACHAVEEMDARRPRFPPVVSQTENARVAEGILRSDARIETPVKMIEWFKDDMKMGKLGNK